MRRSLLEEASVKADTALAEAEGQLNQSKHDLIAAESALESLTQQLNVKSDQALTDALKNLLTTTSGATTARSVLSLLGQFQKETLAIGSEDHAQAPVFAYAVRAPFDGTVVDFQSMRGELVQAGTPMIVVADLTTMWVDLDILERDLPRLHGRENLPIRFTTDGLKGESFEGRLKWLGTEISDKTRTIKALAEVKNTDGLLRANMFGKASILVHQNENAIVVPKEAVQWEGCCHVVFVQLKDDLYAPRKVRLGYEGKDFYEVKVGLLNADPVVTQGSFLLKTEILKSSIGAGCTD